MRFLSEMLRRVATTETNERSLPQPRVRGKSPRARLRQEALSLLA